VEGRETVKFVASGTVQSDNGTQWLWEKYVLPPLLITQ